MGRTPSSLAMKLSNLASLDPYHQARDVKGLKSSEVDRAMWQEYREHHDELAVAGEELFMKYYSADEVLSVSREQKPGIIKEPVGPSKRYMPQSVRWGSGTSARPC
jgi:putative restriction endonuclease